MKPLTPSDLWPLPVYEQVRDELRRQVIAAKQHRRVHVGPYMTFVFENRLTVKFQAMEILRAERIGRPEQVAEELEGWNTMLPRPGELSATLLIELTGTEPEVKAELARLTGLESHVWMEIDGEKIAGAFDPGRDDGTRVSAVQYVRFPVGERRLPLGSSKVELVIDHPHFRHRATLDQATCASLSEDLQPAT